MQQWRKLLIYNVTTAVNSVDVTATQSNPIRALYESFIRKSDVTVVVIIITRQVTRATHVRNRVCHGLN